MVYLILAGAVIAYFLLLAWLLRTDPEMDRELSAVDQDIARRERAQERAVQDALRTQHNVTAFPREKRPR